MKYLIVECRTLCDQFECDAYRRPLCMVDEWKGTKYDVEGYEVYEVQADGFFKQVREYDAIGEEGYALVYYKIFNDIPVIIKKWKNMTSDEAANELVTNLKEYFPFEDFTEDEVLDYFRGNNEWSEQVGDKWYAFGQYWDNNYPTGV